MGNSINHFLKLKQNLTRHIKNVHMNEKYVCPTCNKVSHEIYQFIRGKEEGEGILASFNHRLFGDYIYLMTNLLKRSLAEKISWIIIWTRKAVNTCILVNSVTKSLKLLRNWLFTLKVTVTRSIIVICVDRVSVMKRHLWSISDFTISRNCK